MSDTPKPVPGDPTRPRYFHRELGLVEHISGTTIKHRNAARVRLAKRVVSAEGDTSAIEYMAGMGRGLLGPR